MYKIHMDCDVAYENMFSSLLEVTWLECDVASIILFTQNSYNYSQLILAIYVRKLEQIMKEFPTLSV